MKRVAHTLRTRTHSTILWLAMQRIPSGVIATIMIAAILAGGCGVYYLPGRIPTPQFDSTRDLSVDAGYGVGGWQADVAIAPLNHFWLAGHIEYLSFSDTVEEILHPSVVNAYNGSSLGQLHGEFGLGWYSASHGEEFSLLAGYGRGRLAFIRLKDYPRYPRFIGDTIIYTAEVGRGDFETFFFQGSVPTTITGTNAYARLLLRGEYLRFRNFTLDEKDQPLATAMLIEPRVFFGAPIPDYPCIQFEMQLGLQFKVGGREEFDYQPLHLSFALIGLLDLW